ncbi:hypothetical protein KC717_02715 [Candidatus Dojkabacteria bacterium]|uniref:Uncharacterized protein n=1 Tax=Candidatus Dojkabacteria bacterium TaxID=2099670 RepID=A0A955L7Q4_9BACT|nr:hypothetical protein [Candidatus Dojkabacteria bacterium]
MTGPELDFANHQRVLTPRIEYLANGGTLGESRIHLHPNGGFNVLKEEVVRISESTNKKRQLFYALLLSTSGGSPYITRTGRIAFLSFTDLSPESKPEIELKNPRGIVLIENTGSVLENPSGKKNHYLTILGRTMGNHIFELDAHRFVNSAEDISQNQLPFITPGGLVNSPELGFLINTIDNDPNINDPKRILQECSFKEDNWRAIVTPQERLKLRKKSMAFATMVHSIVQAF